MAVCAHCGAEFIRGEGGRGATAKHCSDRCRRRVERNNQNARKRALRAAGVTNTRGYRPRICARCGEEFIPWDGESRYCSNSCSVLSVTYGDAGGPSCEVPWRECGECGRMFVSRLNVGVCSPTCSEARKQRKIAEYGLRRKGGACTVRCRECGEPFQIVYGEKRRAFCSTTCSRRFHKFNRRAWQKCNGQRQKVHRWIVFERCGGKCGVCGKAVNLALEYPHPMSASMDHIVPLARGGSHTYDNIQLAHLRCNLQKSDTGAGQLRLAVCSAAA